MYARLSGQSRERSYRAAEGFVTPVDGLASYNGQKTSFVNAADSDAADLNQFRWY